MAARPVGPTVYSVPALQPGRLRSRSAPTPAPSTRAMTTFVRRFGDSFTGIYVEACVVQLVLASVVYTKVRSWQCGGHIESNELYGERMLRIEISE